MSEKIIVSPESGRENSAESNEASHEIAMKRHEAAELARQKLGETNVGELSNKAKHEAVSGAEKPTSDEGQAQATRNTHNVHPFIHHAPATALKHQQCSAASGREQWTHGSTT